MASRIINMTIPEELIEEADEVARSEGRTRSELFREAVRRYIAGRGPATKDSSRLLSRLADMAQKGSKITFGEIDGVLYGKGKRR
jgi:metal-responsive CopG/Arc/MetJ family transcriptional regulator